MAIASGVYGASDVRGRIGAVIMSSWRGVQTIRKFTKPVRRWQTTQPIIRATVGWLARHFGTLSQADRDLWQVWADEHPRQNSLGDSFILTAEQMYISLNSIVAKYFGTAAINDQPPAVLIDQTLILFTAVTGAVNPGEIDLAWSLPNAGQAGDLICWKMGGPYGSPARVATPPEMGYLGAAGGQVLLTTITGLVEGAYYWFAIRYVGSDGQTSAWQVAQATPKLT